MERMILGEGQSSEGNEGIEELLSYIRELEEQNRYLRKIVEESDWRITRFQILQESLLSRIYRLRKIMDEKEEPSSEMKEKMNTVLAATTKTKEVKIREQIFEDEGFKREIEEALSFAKIWKGRKNTEGKKLFLSHATPKDPP